VKRRGFLSMLGAAMTAPALPMAAPYFPASMRALAVKHVGQYPIITVLGISNRTGIPMDKAEELLVQLSREGLVGPVVPGPAGPMRAKSIIYKPSAATLHANNIESERLQRQIRRARLNRKRLRVNTKDWLGHLHEICKANNIPLQPRALEAVA